MFTKTYKITEVISKNGIIEKVKIIFVTFVFVLGLRFGSLNTSEIPTPLFTSSEVYQSCVMKSDNSRILTSPPQISDLILKLKGLESMRNFEILKLRQIYSILGKLF